MAKPNCTQTTSNDQAEIIPLPTAKEHRVFQPMEWKFLIAEATVRLLVEAYENGEPMLSPKKLKKRVEDILSKMYGHQYSC